MSGKFLLVTVPSVLMNRRWIEVRRGRTTIQNSFLSITENFAKKKQQVSPLRHFVQKTFSYILVINFDWEKFILIGHFNLIILKQQKLHV